jgi:hypothetical protein
MRHGNAAICHHDHQIPEAQLEARVPGDTQDDDLPRRSAVLEEIFDRYEPLHLSIIVRHPRICTRATGSTVGKKMGLTVESTKAEDGQRRYSIQA